MSGKGREVRRKGEGVEGLSTEQRGWWWGGFIEHKNSLSLFRLQPVSVQVQPPQKASNPKAHSSALEKEGNNQDCFHRPPI